MERQQQGSGCDVTAHAPICLNMDMHNEGHYVNTRTFK